MDEVQHKANPARATSEKDPMTSAPLLFLDFEGPGLREGATPDEVAHCGIFEVAAILMSSDLAHEYGRYETVVRPTPEDLEELHAIPFVLNMHTVNGLLAELTTPGAEDLPTLSDAEDAVLALLAELPADQKVVIAGSGVARYDRPQIQVQLPRLAARLTYDEQDLSSARKRYQQVTGLPIVPPKPEKTHRAMADIEDDIRHLRAFDAVYSASVMDGHTTDPTARRLLALALTEQYAEHDSFLNADGTEIATVRPPQVIQSLLEGVPAIEVVAGFMDITQQLLRLLASTNGMHPDTALAAVRGALVDAAVTGEGHRG
jgi:oligoribonuclease (3'-5' exoribonuclease)